MKRRAFFSDNGLIVLLRWGDQGQSFESQRDMRDMADMRDSKLK